MANYYVGLGQTYATPQAAIDQLKADTSLLAFTEEHKIIIIGGAYDGIVVDGLQPTETYKLIITAVTSNRPVFLNNRNGSSVQSPIEIKSPYVIVERVEARGGAHGMLVSSDATGLIIKQVLVRDPWRVGILINGADEVSIVNSVIYAPSTCVVATGIKKFGIFHSTLKNGMNNQENLNVTLTPGLPDPYPQASVIFIEKLIGDTETVYIRNNNLVAVNGPVFATTERTVRYLNSDYNNLFSTTGIAQFLPTQGKEAMTLQAWRRFTSQDSNSMSEDPKFYQGIVDGDLEDGIYQDLKLRPSSLIRAKAEDSTGVSYPAYVPALTGDFDDLDRTTPRATIGAYELEGSVFNYWDNIFPANHDNLSDIYDAAKAHYADVVLPWYPKVKTGFFWARDHLFYLYSEKQSSRLDQLQWFKFEFTGEVINGTSTVTFDGETLEEDQWNLRGEELIFKSSGFDVTGDAQEVALSGQQLVWVSGDSAFATGDYEWSNTIGNAERIFILDPSPIGGTPIVLTDKSILSNHATGELPFGYAVGWDNDLGLTTLTLQSGELPENQFVGSVANDPYALNDIIDTYTWGAFDTYGDYLAQFPELDAWDATSRTLKFDELSQMTIEWEGSNSGIYEITSLSMNPIHNPKTDGFLSIRNIRAAQWDRTLSDESTLADDWGEGRTGDILPWARVTGKDKWRPLIREFSAPMVRVAAINYPTGECFSIDSVPGPLVALQGATGEEVLFTFMDKEENPWALEQASFELAAADDAETGEFPGYIAHRQFGVYTALGQTLSNIETDHGGHITLRYIPPSDGSVSLFSPPLIISGDYSWFETRYDIYPDNYGNPTIVDEWLERVTATGELITGEYNGSLVSGSYYYTLDEYPLRGSVRVFEDGIRQEVVYNETVQDGQIYVDVENKQIKSKSDGPLDIYFTPVLLWKDPSYPRRIYVHDDITLPSNYIVGYDAWVRITGTGGGVSQVHDIVCRNSYDTGEN